ncbi:hypothetical protein ABFU82_04645 [Nocardioides sp. WV_118_6]
MTRLEGADGDVLAVAREAVRVLREDRATRRALFPRLARLHHERRALQDLPELPRTPLATRVGTVLWWLLHAAGLTAVLTTAVMLGPSGRRNTYLGADDALAVALPAGVVALVLLAGLLVLLVPAGETPRSAVGLAVITGLVVAGLVGYRLAAGTSDGRGFSGDQVRSWTPWALAGLAVLVLLVVRLERARRRTPPRAVRRDPAQVRRHLRRQADWLAGAPTPAGTTATWERRLTRLEERGVPATTIAQARSLSPAAWLAWTFDDPRLDVSGVLAGTEGGRPPVGAAE